MSGFIQEQGFQTQPLANLGLAVYTLNIVAPGSSYLPVMTYTFPLSPQMVRKSARPVNTPMSVQGYPPVNGVARIVDQYGQEPPTFTISGTTGWKVHATDGWIWNGKTSIQRLQAVFTRFAQLNQAQMLSDSPDLYKLEFYDFWMGDFWEVVPAGEIVIQQDANRPILSNFQLTLTAIRAASDPILIAETLAMQALAGNGAVAAIAGVQAFVAGAVGNY